MTLPVTQTLAIGLVAPSRREQKDKALARDTLSACVTAPVLNSDRCRPTQNTLGRHQRPTYSDAAAVHECFIIQYVIDSHNRRCEAMPPPFPRQCRTQSKTHSRCHGWQKALQLSMPRPLRSSLAASTPGPGEESECSHCRPDPSMSVRRIRGLNALSGSWAFDPSWNGSWMPVPESYSLVTSSAGASAAIVSGHS